jgi:hypothetical protein
VVMFIIYTCVTLLVLGLFDPISVENRIWGLLGGCDAHISGETSVGTLQAR